MEPPQRWLVYSLFLWPAGQDSGLPAWLWCPSLAAVPTSVLWDSALPPEWAHGAAASQQLMADWEHHACNRLRS